MNPYNFSALFFAFCTFFIGVFVWLKRRDAVGNCFLTFSYFASVWGIGYAIMISPNVSYEVALAATRFSQGCSVFIPVTWFHLTLILTNRMTGYKRLLVGLYIIAGGVFLSSLTSWYIPVLKPALGFKYYTRPGPAYHFYPLLYFWVVPLGFMQLLHGIKSARNKEEKIQFKGLLISTFFGFVGGSFCFLPVYEIMVPQYGLFVMPIYPFVLGYFMIRHRLFDMEAAIQAFQKEKLATLGLLAASVNHEIRNPLYAAKGLIETYLENKKEGLKGKNPEEVSEKALAQLNRALEVISKLNRFAKPTGEGSSQSASIPEAIQQVLELVSYEFELDKIHIKNQIDQNIPHIQVDQRQLEEILFNLIVNACQAMKGGGELRLSAERKASKIIVFISDTGTGVSVEQLRHLFEPFYTTKGERGTGLGLYITKQLIERNGGKVTVKSQEGRGTTFYLEFNAL